jgi:two-component system, sensor histidine kinase and response regulator
VLRNIIQNAIKFSHKESSVDIRVEEIENKIKFSIIDQGTGMTQNIVDNLFSIDNAYSTKGTNNEPGTGLGLVICKEFITIHHGEIWAESEPGKGSRFCFTLCKNES